VQRRRDRAKVEEAIERTTTHWGTMRLLTGAGAMLAAIAGGVMLVTDPPRALAGLLLAAVLGGVAALGHLAALRHERMIEALREHIDTATLVKRVVAQSSNGMIRHTFLLVQLPEGHIGLRVPDEEAADLARAIGRLAPGAEIDVPGAR
jgi:hypothetical protein